MGSDVTREIVYTVVKYARSSDALWKGVAMKTANRLGGVLSVARNIWSIRNAPYLTLARRCLQKTLHFTTAKFVKVVNRCAFAESFTLRMRVVTRFIVRDGDAELTYVSVVELSLAMTMREITCRLDLVKIIPVSSIGAVVEPMHERQRQTLNLLTEKQCENIYLEQSTPDL